MHLFGEVLGQRVTRNNRGRNVGKLQQRRNHDVVHRLDHRIGQADVHVKCFKGAAIQQGLRTETIIVGNLIRRYGLCLSNVELKSVTEIPTGRTHQRLVNVLRV